MDNLEQPNDIEDFKNKVNYFSTFYNNIFTNELPNFLKLEDRTRQQLVDDIYKHNSKLECLLRETMDEDIIECEEQL